MADVPDKSCTGGCRLDGKFDRMSEDIREMKGGLTNVEVVIAGLVTAGGRTQQAIDRMSDRPDCIERRPDIAEDAALGPNGT